MKLIILGDIHFSAINPWDQNIGNAFLDWFGEEDFGPDATLIQVGDVHHRDVNPGQVVFQVERFAHICQKKFVKTYILNGNHDFRMYKNKYMSANDFLNLKENIYVISNPLCKEFDKAPVLFLPHINTETSLEEHYSKHLDDFYYKNKYALIIGHVAAYSEKLFKAFRMTGVDFTKFQYEKLILGHVHKRIENYYVGSVWPLNAMEANDKNAPRIYIEVEIKNGECFTTEKPIQTFVEYKTVEYPDDIPKTDSNITSIYTVENCPNLSIAREHYNDYFIKAIDNSKVIAKSVSTDQVNESLAMFSTKLEAYESYVKETGAEHSKALQKLLISLLKEKENE